MAKKPESQRFKDEEAAIKEADAEIRARLVAEEQKRLAVTAAELLAQEPESRWRAFWNGVKRFFTGG